jgi:hypothetical protein
MKRFLMYAMAAVISLTPFSCSSDDDDESGEEPGGGKTALTGTWQLIWTDGPEDMLVEGVHLIQFKKDGTCVTVSDDEDGVVITNGKYSADDSHIRFVSTDEDDWQLPMSLEITKKESDRIYVTTNVLGFQLSGYLEKVSDSEIGKYFGKEEAKQVLSVNGVSWQSNKNDPPVYSTVFFDGVTNYLYVDFYKSGTYWWPDYVHLSIHTGKEYISNGMSLTDLLRQGKDVTVEAEYCTDPYGDNEVSGMYIVNKNNCSQASGSMTIKSLSAKGSLTIEFKNFTMPQDEEYDNTGAPAKLRLDGTVSFSYTND